MWQTRTFKLKKIKMQCVAHLWEIYLNEKEHKVVRFNKATAAEYIFLSKDHSYEQVLNVRTMKTVISCGTTAVGNNH